MESGAGAPATRFELGVDTRLFCNDVCNALHELCADGVDSLEEALLQGLHGDERTVRHVVQGTDALFQKLCASVAAHFVDFERHVAAVAALPPSLGAPPAPAPAAVAAEAAPPGPPPATAEEESSLHAALAVLRSQSAAAVASRAAMRREVAALEHELVACGPAGAALRSVPPPAGKENESLVRDVAALAAEAHGLAAALARAADLRAGGVAGLLPDRGGVGDALAMADSELRARQAAAAGPPTAVLRALNDTLRSGGGR